MCPLILDNFVPIKDFETEYELLNIQQLIPVSFNIDFAMLI